MSLKTNVGISAVELPTTIEDGDGEYGSPLDAPGSPGPMRYSSLSLRDLVCLCAAPHDDEAWEEFVCRVGRPISLTIVRTARQCEEPRPPLEDLVQETYVKLWEARCRLRDFAMQHPEAILGYIKITAANTARDYIKQRRSKKKGGDKPHVPPSEVDPEDPKSQGRTDFRVLLREIDELLKHCLTEPNQERDRMIFWFYFRQGMSTKEIASLPTIGLSAKGVGSVIERLDCCIREQILRLPADSEDDGE